MVSLKISKPNRRIVGEITLDGSKSISNRILIIKALCKTAFPIHNLSTSNDTQTLVKLLAQTDSDTFDCGAAGTTFRFLTAHFALHRSALDIAPPALDAPSRPESLRPQALFGVRDVWVGAMVPKRWAPRAVTRNAIKRQIYTVSASFGLRLPAAPF